MVEQLIRNEQVGGSIPFISSIKNRQFSSVGGFFYVCFSYSYVPYFAVFCHTSVAKRVENPIKLTKSSRGYIKMIIVYNNKKYNKKLWLKHKKLLTKITSVGNMRISIFTHSINYKEVINYVQYHYTRSSTKHYK